MKNGEIYLEVNISLELLKGCVWKMLKKDKNLDSLDSRSSTLGSQANHSEKKIIDRTAKSIPNNIISIQDNKGICEANGCSENATNELRVNVGKFGEITLFLCTACLPKFITKGATIENVQ